MAPDQRLRGGGTLARGEAAHGARAMDEDFQPRSPWVAHRRMVGRAFIAEAGGQRGVDPTRAGRRRGRVTGVGLLRLDAAMGHGGEVGDREMGQPIGAVGRARRWRHWPSTWPRRRRHCGRARIGRPCGAAHRHVIARKAHPAQPSGIGPVMGQQQPLPEAQRHHSPHLGQPLQCRRTRAETAPAWVAEAMLPSESPRNCGWGRPARRN
jgi:hypothetical protein